jgi:hypothetical protein
MNPVGNSSLIINNYTVPISHTICTTVYGWYGQISYKIYHSKATGRSFVVQQVGSINNWLVYEIPPTTATCFVEAVKGVFTIINLIGGLSEIQF